MKKVSFLEAIEMMVGNDDRAVSSMMLDAFMWAHQIPAPTPEQWAKIRREIAQRDALGLPSNDWWQGNTTH